MTTNPVRSAHVAGALRSSRYATKSRDVLGRLLPPLMMGAILVGVALVLAARSAPASATATLDSEEQIFVNLINQYRQQNGAGPLAINPQLQDAAEWMSADMGAYNYFSHTDHLGRDPFVRMAAFGYNYNTWRGENIAAGYTTAQSVFDGWRNSPGHNANMLNPAYKVMGIARAYATGSNYGWYWTNDFGGFDPDPNPNPTPAPTPTPPPTPAPDPAADSDGDGSTNATETFLGTNMNDSCGNPDFSKPGSPSLAWPADLAMGPSANKIDLQDIASFVAPIPRLDTSPGDAGFDKRWDLVPGKGIAAHDINLQDLTTLIVLAPPMLGNQTAFGGPSCPNP